VNSFTKALLILFVFAASTAQSQVRYELPDGTILEGVKRLNGALPHDALTILGLTLDRNNFKDVKNVLGPTTKLPRTNDPHEADIICYAADNDPTVCLSFTSGWPENPTDKLTSFTLSRCKLRHLRGPCTLSAKLTAQVTTANGLVLGITQSRLTSILGVPSKITPDWMVYSFEMYRKYLKVEREKMPRAPGGGEFKGEYNYSNLIAHFTGGKMDLLTVSVGGETDW
jgi:hypothetical protein